MEPCFFFAYDWKTQLPSVKMISGSLFNIHRFYTLTTWVQCEFWFGAIFFFSETLIMSMSRMWLSSGKTWVLDETLFLYQDHWEIYQNKAICAYFILFSWMQHHLPKETVALQSSPICQIDLLFLSYGLGKFRLLVFLAVSRLIWSSPL